MSARSRYNNLTLSPLLIYGLGRKLYPWSDLEYYTSGYCDSTEVFELSESMDPSNLNRTEKLTTRPLTHTKESISLVGTKPLGVLPTAGKRVPDWACYASTQYPCYTRNVAGTALKHAKHAPFDSEPPDYTYRRDVALRDAFFASKPNLDTNFSLPNFIFELKDLNRMFHIFDRKWKMKKHIENGYLNLELGWKPMMSDIQNLFAAIKRIKAHWDHVTSNQGNMVIQKGSASYKTVSQSSVPFQQGDQYDDFCSYEYNSNVAYFGDIMCQTTYSYDVLDTDSLGRSKIPNHLLALSSLQALGITANPQIIWDALPFTFLLDWFLPVGDALNEMNSDTFVPGHVVHSTDLHEHRARVVESNGILHLPTRNSSEKGGNYRIKYVDETYVRTPNITSSDIPEISPLHKLEIKLPSGKKWFLGAVLGSAIFGS